MVKEKKINPALLLETWKVGVNVLLFPDDIASELRPDVLLEKWSDIMPSTREQRRDEVDFFVAQVLDADTPEGLWTLLRKTDPELVALYVDRLEAATFALMQIAQEDFGEVCVPESWYELTKRLLYQKPLQ